jgi:diguanylate cyclase (GGDEF)-like protein
MGEVPADPTDPLTGLPWEADVRAWIRSALEHRRDVTVACIRVTTLGAVTAALGDVAADAVLRAVAHLLGGAVDPSTDFLCRCGGGEFALATVRPGPDAAALTDLIRKSLSLSVTMRGTRHRITAHMGVAAGRRAEASDSSDIAAVADDLLNRAHAACTPAEARAKGSRLLLPPVENAARRSDARTHLATRLRLSGVTIREEPHGSTCTVELGLGPRGATGTASARAHGTCLSFLIAEATLQAIACLVGRETGFSVEDLVEAPFEDQKLVIAVLTHGESRKRMVGGVCTSDLRQGVAQAVLHALNRQVSWDGAEGS